MSKLLDKANSKENREAFLNRISKKAGRPHHLRISGRAEGIKEKGCVISPDNGSKVGLNQRSPAEGKGKAQKLLAQG